TTNFRAARFPWGQRCNCQDRGSTWREANKGSRAALDDRRSRAHSYILTFMRGSAMFQKLNAAGLFVRVFILSFTVALFALPSYAQSNKADIVGTITDSNGAAVQGATVTI